MALPIVEVRVLADAQNLEGIGTPHRIIVRGVETVRDALPMLAVLTKKTLALKGVELVKEAAEEESAGTTTTTAATATPPTSTATATPPTSTATATPPTSTATATPTPPTSTATATLRRRAPATDGSSSTCNRFAMIVAVLACLLEELLDDLVPLLTHKPGHPDILRRRLLTNAKEIRRVALVVTGQPGELSLKLGNKIKKMVSHAFWDKRGAPRTEAQRTAWVAQRLNSLQDQARKLYEDYAVVLE